MRMILERLVDAEYSCNDFLRNRSRLKFSCRLAVLLYIHAMFLADHQTPEEEQSEGIRRQLGNLQRHILSHNLDRQGSIEKLWHVIMTKQGKAKATLDEEVWQTVLMMNVFKQMSLEVIDDLTILLHGYLKGNIRACGDDIMHTRVIKRVRQELKLC